MSDFILIAATIVFFAICVLYIKWCDGARADGTVPGDRFFDPIEWFIYGVCGLDHKREQRWNVDALSLVAFSLVSLLMLYGLSVCRAVWRSTPLAAPASRRGAHRSEYHCQLALVTKLRATFHSPSC